MFLLQMAQLLRLRLAALQARLVQRGGALKRTPKAVFAFQPLLPGESQVPEARTAPHRAGYLTVADLAGQDGDAPIAIRVA